MGNYNQKIVKARNEYTCCYCNNQIHKGETHIYTLYRHKLRHWDDGEYYWSEWKSCREHNFDCITPEECQKGNHEFKYFEDEYFLGAISRKGSERCINCFKENV